MMVGVLCAAPLAHAVRSTAYADWGAFTGSANNYATTMQLPVTGFPAASVPTDSRAGSVGIISGATAWVGENTPLGLKYGSSRDHPYVSLRPKADNPTGGSTTTYTFAEPTPPTGWTVAFADIAADQVHVSAKDADGNSVPAAALGFAGGFNYCDTTPRPSACSASVGDVPTWNPATQVLIGNPTASDTVGATGWFEPTVSLSSLTGVFTRRAGFPLYSTSFAAVARTLSGTVTDVSTGAGSCPVGAVTVRLVGPNGEDLGTTTPAADGTYSFGQVATQPGYTVSVEPPATCAAVGGRSRMVSTAADDAVADFSVRAIIPQPVSGQVTADGAALPGVSVTLHHPDGTTETTTTGADGGYLFDDNEVDSGYFVSIDVPAGYSGPDQRAPFDIDAAPITGQDFALTANPDVSGTVTGGGAGIGGVTVTITPETGPPLSTVTSADGSYVFERLPAGTYTISIEPPPGYDPAPPITGVTVAGTDVTDQDFALSRRGAVGGQVTDDSGAPIAGAEVLVDGPGGSRTLTTDPAGQYFLDGLAAGTYTLTLSVPDGYDAVSPTTLTVTITAAGEIRGGQDFVVEQAPDEPSPTPTPPNPTDSTPPTTPGVNPGTGWLPDTGGPPMLSLYAGLSLLACGIACLLLARFPRHE
jgi:hypothetical protein